MEEGHLTAAQKLSHYSFAETSPFIILYVAFISKCDGLCSWKQHRLKSRCI